jgi:sec-independent protein translocase protein TatA
MLSGLENPIHMLILLLVVLMLFGAKRLPELGRSLGTGLREFKSGVTGPPPNAARQQPLPLATTNPDNNQAR